MDQQLREQGAANLADDFMEQRIVRADEMADPRNPDGPRMRL